MRRLLFLSVLFLISSLGAVLAQDSTAEPITLPTLDQLQSGWNAIAPGGDTICARGTPYQFFVRPGDPSKLLIYFEGGGGCWDALTCSTANPTFHDAVSSTEPNNYLGVFSPRPRLNPIADYSIVFVSYCSGDFHVGNAERTYSGPLGTYTIAFRGAINTQVALDWAYANYAAPDNLLIAGSSAGSIGAIAHADAILQHYVSANADVHAAVFGDAGVGVNAGNTSAFDEWNLTDIIPQHDAFADVQTDNLVVNLTRALAQTYPDVRVGEFTNAQDAVQSFFFRLLGGDETQWEAVMRADLGDLQAEPNFRSYIADGTDHTILALPGFYTLQQDGVYFRDWFGAFLHGDPIENVGS